MLSTENNACFSVKWVKSISHRLERSHLTSDTAEHLTPLLSKGCQRMPPASGTEMRVKSTQELWPEPLFAIGNKIHTGLSTDACQTVFTS